MWKTNEREGKPSAESYRNVIYISTVASWPLFPDDGDSEIFAMGFHPKLFKRILLISILTVFPGI
jgi:hypothetical protein